MQTHPGEALGGSRAGFQGYDYDNGSESESAAGVLRDVARRRAERNPAVRGAGACHMDCGHLHLQVCEKDRSIRRLQGKGRNTGDRE